MFGEKKKRKNKKSTLRSDITIKDIKSNRLRSSNMVLFCFLFLCLSIFLCKSESLLTAWKMLLFQIPDEKKLDFHLWYHSTVSCHRFWRAMHSSIHVYSHLIKGRIPSVNVEFWILGLTVSDIFHLLL